MQPGLDYFQVRFNSTEGMLSVFKAARYFSSQKINDIHPDAGAIYSLKVFPFLDSKAILDGLNEELQSYLAKVFDIHSTVDILQRWSQNESNFFHAGQPLPLKFDSYNLQRNSSASSTLTVFSH